MLIEMKNNGSLIWLLLGLTQLFMMFGMWGELKGPLTTLFGSSGAAMIALAGYFWIQEKRNGALADLQGYNKHEKTELVRDEKGVLVERPIATRDSSSLMITFIWFAICWLSTQFLF